MDEMRFTKIVNEVMKEFPEYSYDIRKSSKSSSVYLYVHDELGLIKSLRVSDHKNMLYGRYDKEMIAPKIREKVLKKTIVNLCESLKRKILSFLLYGVSIELAQKSYA